MRTNTLTEQQRKQLWSPELWSCTDADGLAIPCLSELLPEGVDQSILPDLSLHPFGQLPESIRMVVCRWLVENVAVTTKTTAVCIAADQINDLLKQSTGILLTETQLCEALLLLGMEPQSTAPGHWRYRVHQDCPVTEASMRR